MTCHAKSTIEGQSNSLLLPSQWPRLFICRIRHQSIAMDPLKVTSSAAGSHRGIYHLTPGSVLQHTTRGHYFDSIESAKLRKTHTSSQAIWKLLALTVEGRSECDTDPLISNLGSTRTNLHLRFLSRTLDFACTARGSWILSSLLSCLSTALEFYKWSVKGGYSRATVSVYTVVQNIVE